MVISDALAGHLHQVQVRARDEVNNESQWSDWSPLLLGRPWEGQRQQGSPAEELLQDLCSQKLLISVRTTPEPAEEATEHHLHTVQPKPDTSTAKTHCEFSGNRPVSRSNGQTCSEVLLTRGWFLLP